MGLGLINGAIMVIGQSAPFILSPFHLKDKLAALEYWVRHMPAHWSRSHPNVQETERLLERAAKRHQLPYDLVWAVAKTESNLLPHRISPAGAMGFMQLMPDTARWLKVEDPFDPEDNIEGGSRFLAWLWRRYDGDRRRIAAAYNAGPGRIPKRGPVALPGETRIYVAKVLAASAQAQRAMRGKH